MKVVSDTVTLMLLFELVGDGRSYRASTTNRHPSKRTSSWPLRNRSANPHANNNLDGQIQVIVDRSHCPVHESQIRNRSAHVDEGRRENRGHCSTAITQPRIDRFIYSEAMRNFRILFIAIAHSRQRGR